MTNDRRVQHQTVSHSSMARWVVPALLGLALLPAAAQARPSSAVGAGEPERLASAAQPMPALVIEGTSDHEPEPEPEAAYALPAEPEDHGQQQNLVFLLSAGGILLLGFVHSAMHVRRTNLRNAARELAAREQGLDTPPSLHPHINAQRCIGCGTCAMACPDKSVLGVVDGHARVLTPANCVGHGACARECPAGAIELVFGTERNPVDLPRLNGAYQTNVPGIYVAGELGGMGLIANAFDQAIEAVNNVFADLRQDRHGRRADVLDLLVIGAGPAGLGAALRAHELGLSYLCVDQHSWGGAIRSYPRAKIVMTRPMRVPLYGPVKLRETTKEALVELWSRIVEQTHVRLQPQTRVEKVERQGSHFVVHTSRGSVAARRVMLAIGRRGTPRKLGVRGENQSHVAYEMLEPERWAGKRVVVVGGGDVACETALALAAQPGTQVALLYRGKSLSRPKPANRQRVQDARRAGRIALVLDMAVQSINPRDVTVTVGGGAAFGVPADQVFVCVGGEPPTKFLQKMGVQIVTLRGEPLHGRRSRAVRPASVPGPLVRIPTH